MSMRPTYPTLVTFHSFLPLLLLSPNKSAQTLQENHLDTKENKYAASFCLHDRGKKDMQTHANTIRVWPERVVVCMPQTAAGRGFRRKRGAFSFRKKAGTE